MEFLTKEILSKIYKNKVTNITVSETRIKIHFGNSYIIKILPEINFDAIKLLIEQKDLKLSYGKNLETKIYFCKINNEIFEDKDSQYKPILLAFDKYYKI